MNNVNFDGLFNDSGNRYILYNEKKIYRTYRIDKPGSYKLKFNFVLSNSIYNQAIAIILYQFKGKVSINGKEQKLGKREFFKFHFFEKSGIKNFEVFIELKRGMFSICNGTDLAGDFKFSHTMTRGSCFYYEEISKNRFRFYCNDYEPDDDFDDLIFELEIVELSENTGDGTVC